jgi:hypothetical protein
MTGYERELVALRALDNAIEHEDVAISFRFEYQNVLVERFLYVKDFIDLEGHRLTGPLRGDLAKPTIYRRDINMRNKGGWHAHL